MAMIECQEGRTERLERESFEFSIGNLQRVIRISHYGIDFEPSLEEVFGKTAREADLEVVVSLMRETDRVPTGYWQGGTLYAELEPHRPTFQLQKLLAALYSLEFENLYPLHCALAKPLDSEERSVVFLGASKAGKGTIISRLCSFSDSNTGYLLERGSPAGWRYLEDDVLLFNAQENRAYLVGRVRTRCINLPDKHIIIEPGEVDAEGYPVGLFILLDKSRTGGELERMTTPSVIPQEVIGHPAIASPIYEKLRQLPHLQTELPVYRLGTNGNIKATLEAVDRILSYEF